MESVYIILMYIGKTILGAFIGLIILISIVWFIISVSEKIDKRRKHKTGSNWITTDRSRYIP